MIHHNSARQKYNSYYKWYAAQTRITVSGDMIITLLYSNSMIEMIGYPIVSFLMNAF